MTSNKFSVLIFAAAIFTAGGATPARANRASAGKEADLELFALEKA
jgi:hypothetical protein